jgi:Rad3-related DNA helicase
VITTQIVKLLSKEARDRVLIYNGTAEKEKMLGRFLSEENLVLIGPSILEGLDLSDDKSRFQIFLKVPYPYIGDKLVKAKMDSIKGWYAWKTVVMIQQGIGRSVRSVDDWCVTYLLDACFKDVLKWNKNAFSEEFLDRIEVVEEYEEV